MAPTRGASARGVLLTALSASSRSPPRATCRLGPPKPSAAPSTRRARSPRCTPAGRISTTTPATSTTRTRASSRSPRRRSRPTRVPSRVSPRSKSPCVSWARVFAADPSRSPSPCPRGTQRPPRWTSGSKQTLARPWQTSTPYATPHATPSSTPVGAKRPRWRPSRRCARATRGRLGGGGGGGGCRARSRRARRGDARIRGSPRLPRPRRARPSSHLVPPHQSAVQTPRRRGVGARASPRRVLETGIPRGRRRGGKERRLRRVRRQAQIAQLEGDVRAPRGG